MICTSCGKEIKIDEACIFHYENGKQHHVTHQKCITEITHKDNDNPPKEIE